MFASQPCGVVGAELSAIKRVTVNKEAVPNKHVRQPYTIYAKQTPKNNCKGGMGMRLFNHTFERWQKGVSNKMG